MKNNEILHFLFAHMQKNSIFAARNESTIKNQKLMINGQLFIQRDGKTYSITGQEVR